MENRDKIIKSAMYLFCKNGFRATSIKEISTRAKVSQGNIYTYFSSKDELYSYIFEKMSPKQPFDKVSIYLDEITDFTEFTDTLIHLLIDIVKNNKPFFKLVLIDITDFNGSHTKKYLKVIEEEFSTISKFQQTSLFSNEFNAEEYFKFFTWLLFTLGYSDLVFKRSKGKSIDNSIELDILTYILKYGIGGKV